MARGNRSTSASTPTSEHRSPDRRREVERFAQRHEPDPEVSQFVEERHEVPQVAAESTERRDRDQVETAPARIGEEARRVRAASRAYLCGRLIAVRRRT